MSLAGKLATTFVKAARQKKAAPDVDVPPPRVFSVEDIPGAMGTSRESLRQEFEESLAEEKNLRQKAREYARLARQRAGDQPGAAGEFFKRLLPIPYSGGELAWRGPTVAATAIGGWHLLPRILREAAGEGANLEELARALRITQHGAALPTQLEAVLRQRVGPFPQHFDPEQIAQRLQGASIEDLAKIVGRGTLSPTTEQALQRLGVSRKELQEAYLRAVPSVGGRGREPAQFFREAKRWPKWLGGAAGLGVGSVLTGLPMAIRAGVLRRTGGELAQSARKRMRKAVIKAEREQFRRENIVRTMKGEAPLPLSEWKARRKGIKKDWGSAMKEYRALAKARRKGQKRHGVSAVSPEEKEAS
jgi:hypothetical protein